MTNSRNIPASPPDDAQLRQQGLSVMTHMAAGLAHDFNNYLAAIVGNNAVLARHLADSPGLADCAHRIATAANMALELTHQLAAISAQLDVDPVPVNPHVIVDDAVAVLRPMIREGLTFATSVEPDCPSVAADREHVVDALGGLLRNAVESMVDRTGAITVAAQRYASSPADRHAAPIPVTADRPLVAFSVTDRGCGFSPDQLRHAFEPYRSSRIRGRGMGLPVAFGIARAHGGSVIIQPRPDGEGSRVELLIPAVA